jgi:hypothetical protein
VVAETSITCSCRIDLPGVADRQLDAEGNVGQQIDLVEQHQRGGMKHVRVLERLVFSLGHRKDHHLVRLAKIEGRRTDEIADVLDQQQRIVGRRQLVEGVANHVRVEMTALAGIDLHRRRAGGADPFGVAAGLLVALDDGDRQSVLQQLDGAAQQVVFPEPGLDTRLRAKIPCSSKRRRFCGRVAVVLGQDVALDLHHPRGVVASLPAVVPPWPIAMRGYRAGVHGHARCRVQRGHGPAARPPHGGAWPPIAHDGAVAHSAATLPQLVWLRGGACRRCLLTFFLLGQGLTGDASLPGTTTASRTHLLSPVIIIRPPAP